MKGDAEMDVQSTQRIPEGLLDVTMRFVVPVLDLAHFDATTLAEAATNLDKWYKDGSVDVFSDMSCYRIDIEVRVKSEDSSAKEIET